VDVKAWKKKVVRMRVPADADRALRELGLTDTGYTGQEECAQFKSSLKIDLFSAPLVSPGVSALLLQRLPNRGGPWGSMGLSSGM
jgi:hypothetical protein